MSEEPNKEPASLLDQLRRMLVHHEAKASKLRDAIKAVESNPQYEEIHTIVKNARQ